MLDNSARSPGIFREQWLVDYYRPRRPALVAWREAKAGQQQIIAMRVKKLGSLWLHADLLLLFERALAGELTATHSVVLSPSNPVVWDHKHAEQLFDSSYWLECYTPAPKRQYGYLVLPLLYRGQLVGRMDVKMHRRTNILEVIFLWLQGGIKPTTMLQKGLCQATIDFVSWRQTVWVTLRYCP